MAVATPASAQVRRAVMEGLPATSNSIYVDTVNVRVGVANAAPAYPLDVTGDVRSTGYFRGNGSLLTGLPITSTAALQAQINAVAVSTGVLSSDVAALKISTGALDTAKVNRAGDTMSGQLTVSLSSVTVTGNISSYRYDINGSSVISVSGGPGSTFVGLGSGNLSSGIGNTFVGNQAGAINTTGALNVFVGGSGASNVSGNYNTYIGAGSGNSATGSNNTFLGKYAGYINTGSDNVLVGSGAGEDLTTGSSNILIGKGVEAESPTSSGYVNIGNLIVGDVVSSSLTIKGSLYSDGNINGNLVGLASLNVAKAGDTMTGDFSVVGGSVTFNSHGQDNFVSGGGYINSIEDDSSPIRYSNRVYPLPLDAGSAESAALYMRIDPVGAVNQQIGLYAEITEEQEDTEAAAIKIIHKGNGDAMYVALSSQAAIGLETASFYNGTRGIISTLQTADAAYTTLYQGLWQQDTVPLYGGLYMDSFPGNAITIRKTAAAVDAQSMFRIWSNDLGTEVMSIKNNGDIYGADFYGGFPRLDLALSTAAYLGNTQTFTAHNSFTGGITGSSVTSLGDVDNNFNGYMSIGTTGAKDGYTSRLVVKGADAYGIYLDKNDANTGIYARHSVAFNWAPFSYAKALSLHNRSSTWGAPAAIGLTGQSNSNRGIELVGINYGTSSEFAIATSTTGAGSEKMRITGDGKIGIGDTTPDANLEILATSANTPSSYLLAVSSQNDTTGNIFGVLANGNVGIKGIPEDIALVVNGELKGQGPQTSIQIRDTTTGGSTWATYSGFPALGDYTIRETGVANRIVIKKTTGNVGIGNTAPVAKLDVSGSVNISSATIKIYGTGAPTTGGALCLNASGDMSKCTSAIDASGNCTCP